jgi:hypothetical protein
LPIFSQMELVLQGVLHKSFFKIAGYYLLISSPLA